jgi:hypothetical protein
MTLWKVEGTVLVACNCDWGCPCNFNARPSRGNCEGGWSWIIEKGTYGPTSLDGLGLSVYADWPGAIHEGNGKAVGLIDERADPVQRDALTHLVRGDLGGPWGIFRNTYQLQGPFAAAYDFQPAGHHTRLRVADIVHLHLQPIRNPVTGVEAFPEILLPQGIVMKRANVAASAEFRVTEGVQYDHSGQYTSFGRFAYEGTIS